jgi:hypothetical protein
MLEKESLKKHPADVKINYFGATTWSEAVVAVREKAAAVMRDYGSL